MNWLDNLTDDKKARLLADFDARGAEHLTYANGDRDFAIWLFITDTICRHRTGVSIFDLADFCWHDQYDDEASPNEALRAALAAEGF